MKRCKVGHKKKYKTKQSASNALLKLWLNRPELGMLEMHVYKCPNCGYWHVGHKQGINKRRKEFLNQYK